MTENEFKNRLLESDLTPNSRLLCFVLLQYRNRKTGDCYPSQTTLSQSCGMCRNSISRAIKGLEDSGFITTSKKRMRGQKFTSTFYHFDLQCSAGEPSNEPSNEHAPDAHKPIKPIKPINPPLPPKGGGVETSFLGRFDMMVYMDDNTTNRARYKAPKWDIYHLANVYNEGINSGSRARPSNPKAAFPEWCAKYTKGKQP